MKKNKMIKRWLQILFVLVGVFFEIKAQTPTTDLTAHLVSTSAPSGATLEWHNALPIGAGNIVATPTTVAPGTYYAVYNLGSCYSIPSPLRVITNTCPSTTVDIRTAVDSTSKPTGSIITFHSDAVATTANILSTSAIASAGAGTYFVAYAQYDALSSTYCYSQTSAIVVVSTSCIQANPDASPATAGLPTTIPVLGNDKNPDGTPVTDLTKVTLPTVSTPTKGTATVNPDGTITYTPNPGTSGTDSFVYTVCDKTNPSVCDTAKVMVTITPAPQATPDSPFATASLPTTIPVLSNDKNPDGTPVTDLSKVTLPTVSTPTKGTATVNPDGTITYTPNPGTSGTDSFVYTVCDKANPSVCDTAKVTVTITPSPGANPDAPVATAGLPTTISVLSNDKNPDGTPITDLSKVTLPTVSTPTKGTATVNPDGTITYTPNLGTSGTDSFVYTICDKTNPSVCDTATVTVTITPAPVATPDASPATAGLPTTIPVLGNDKNPEGTPVTDLTKVTLPTVSTPTKGTATVNPDGTITYTPNPGTSGTDSFVYTVCDKANTSVCDTAKVTVTITPAPVANPDTKTAIAGLGNVLTVLSNDKNPDGTPVTNLSKVTLPTVTTPTKGTATVNPDGTITYTPNLGTSGTDTFVYTICDKTNPSVCDTAKVTVTITPAPAANPDASPATAGLPTTIPVLSNDKNPDGTPVTDLTKVTLPTVTTPTKGTATVNPDGTITYTPNPGTSGTDSFVYTVCDKTNPSVCDTAKVTVTITPAPVANPDTKTAIAGLGNVLTILGNDKNPDGTPVTDLSKVTLPTLTTPTKGTATVNPDGTITYTPNPGTSGTDTFVYTICDKANPSVCDTAKVTVTITPAPVANPDTKTAIAGLGNVLTVLGNDKNPDGTPVTDLTKVTLPTVSTPTKGTATVNPDGTITYTPNPGTSGTDSFVYTVCDKANPSVCDTAKVMVTITPAPQATPDSPFATAGLPTTIPVLGNDKNPDGTPVTDLSKVTLPTVTTPTKGTATVNPDGTITYTPNPGTSGTDSFVYTVCDKANPSVCDTAKVMVTITPAPQATPDSPFATAGLPTTIPVLGNDKNPDGTPVTDLSKVTLPTVTTPTKGTATVNPDGTITYTPNPGTSGTDSFVYTICDKTNPSVCDTAKVTVTITPAPVANPDASPATAGLPTTIPVLGNDKNPDGTPVTDLSKVTLPTVSTPTKGTATVNPDGTITYTPNPGTSGTDSFVYTICDKANPSVCDTAKVTVTINASPTPQANFDAQGVTAGIASTIPVLSNDKNPDGTAVTDLTKITTPSVTTAPTKGTATVNPDGTITYTANAGTTGTDSFIYTICNKVNTSVCDTAKVIVTISPIPTPGANPDAPVATAGLPTTIPVLSNDKNPDGTPVTDLSKVTLPTVSTPTKGTATVNPDGTITYTPNPGTSGTDTFVYTICDKANPSVCDTAKVTVTITPAPVANPDTKTAIAGLGNVLTVLSNDKNPDGTPVTDLSKVTLPTVTTPTKGTATVNPDGTITYTPNPGTSGTDSFVYTVCDKANPSVCDTAKVTVSITPAPVANPDASPATAGLSTTIPVLSNDKNPDGTPVTDLTKVTLPTVSTPTKGTATVNPDGTITYTPNPGTSGTDSFVYTICDKTNPSVCDTAKVTVTITPAPVANPDTKTAIAGLGNVLTVLSNDKNPDGTQVIDLTKVTLPTVSTPTKGTATVNPDGTITYTPNSGTSGTDSFVYTICDKANPSVCDTAKVTVTITPAPQATPDSPFATAGLPTTIPVLSNDKNPDGTPVTDLSKVTLPTVSTPTKGTATVNPDGTITYTPNPGTSGTDSFVYTICDKTNPSVCDTAKVTVTINQSPTPQANFDAQGVTAGIASTIPVLSNDKNPDGTAVTDLTKITTPSVTTAPTKGTATVNPDGTITYTANAGTTGTDSFIYTICNKVNTSVCDTARVVLTISAANKAPIATGDIVSTPVGIPVSGNVLTNDDDPEGGILTVSTTPVTAPSKGTVSLNPDGTFTYTPTPNATGQDVFCYSVSDAQGLKDTACVTVTLVSPPTANNDKPIAYDDNTQTSAGTAVVVNVKANDVDPDGNSTLGTPSKLSDPLHGTVSVNPDSSFTYTPATGFTGGDSFTYQICDTGVPSKCDTATVNINVVPLVAGNKTPVAIDDAVLTVRNTAESGTVASNDSDADNTAAQLTYAKVTSPAHGSVTQNANGTYTYTPTTGYVGGDSYTYKVCDPSGACDTATVVITVMTGQTPLANADSPFIKSGEPTTISVLSNDTNPDGTPVVNLAQLTLPTVSTLGANAPTKGTATVNPDGTITYTPNLGASGIDSFIYTICSKASPDLCDTAKVSFTIVPSPTAVNDNLSAIAGINTPLLVLSNDKNSDGTPVTDLTKISKPVIGELPAKGTAIVNTDGSISFVPNAGTNGTDTFTYFICDKNSGVCDSARVIVTITPAPQAIPDSPFATAGLPTTIPVLGNDKNPDGTPVTDLTKVTLPTVSTPTKGTATVNPDGTITYTPNPGTSGTDSFVYTVCDKTNPSVCDTAKVTVTITPAPQATPDSPFATAGLPTTIPVLSNDKNPDGTPVTDLSKVTLPTVSTPTKGTATVNPDGTITYTPNSGTSGTDSFVYTICDKANPSVCDTAKVTVTINASPTPQANFDAQGVTAGIASTIPVLSNDKNPDGTAVADLTKITTPSITTAPTKGTATVNPDGTITYTANAGTTGTDSFIYTICNKVNTSVCDTAKVIVTISPIPTPGANPDAPVATAGLPTTIPVLGNDKNPDGTPVTDLSKVTLPTVSTPTKGTATVNPDGTITYTPSPGTSGTDSFVYTICDKANPSVCDTAKVTVTITPAPVANPDTKTAIAGLGNVLTVLSNDKNPDGTQVIDLTKVTLPTVSTPTKGTATVNPDGTITYTPNAGTSGTDSFVYTICDKTNPSVCDTAKVTVTITPAPQATPDSPFATAGLSTTIPVLSNDKNPDGTPVTDLSKVTLPTVSTPTKGTATVNPDGTITYTPNPGTSGTDSFVYTICDKANPSVCDTAKVTVTINQSPTPQANFDAQGVTAGIASTIPVLSNDKNPDGTAITDLSKITTPSVTTAPTKGTATVNPDGTITYTANAGTTGTDSFIYTICNKVNTSVCDTARVVLTITPANNPPVIIGNPVVTEKDKAVTQCMTIADVDVLDTHTYTSCGLPTNGTVNVTVNNATHQLCVTYTPTPGFIGSDVVCLKVCDQGGACDSLKLPITVVKPVTPSVTPNAPVVVPVSLNTTKDVPVITCLPILEANAGQTHTASICGNPSNGMVNATVNNTTNTVCITYTPNAGYVGLDEFCLEVCDASGLCTQVKIPLTITDVKPSTTPQAPVVIIPPVITDPSTPVTVCGVIKDINPNETHTATLCNAPSGGTAVLNVDNVTHQVCITYTPTAGFTGTDKICVLVCDNTGLCTQKVIPVLVVTPSVQLPSANADNETVAAGKASTIVVLANDKNPDGTAVTDLTKITTPIVSTLPTKGTATVNPDGSITYTPNTGVTGTDSFIYTICNKTQPNSCDTAKVSVTIVATNVCLSPKVYLQGALFGVLLPDTLMRDDLRVKGYLPTASPYSAGITTVGTVASSVFTLTGNNAIVDWVFVELRKGSDSTQVVDSRSALVQRDGDVVDIDGVGTLTFTQATAGDYYVVIKHRNHLGVMSKKVSLTSACSSVDFRKVATPTFTLTPTAISQSQVDVQQGKALWAGNALYDNQVIYQGTANDINVIYQEVINAPNNILVSPSYKLKGYFNGDINMSGEVIFQGTSNDVEFIYQNVIKNHPGNTLKLNYFKIKEQLP